MPFKQFSYLWELMSAGSINQAAQKLYVTPQALRASLDSMEDKLGFRIFERTRQGVVLTPEGEQIEKDIESIIEIRSRWEQLRASRRQIEGTIKVIFSTSMCNKLGPVLLTKCREQYPKLYLQLYEERGDKLLETMLQRRLIGVMGAVPERVLDSYVHYAKSNDYYVEFLREDPYYVFINANSPLAAKQEMELSDLKKLTIACYPQEEKRDEWRELYSYFSGTPYAMMHQESIFHLVSVNPDVACVFPSVAFYSNNTNYIGKIKPMTIREKAMKGVICLFFPNPKSLSNGEKAVLDLLRDELADPEQRRTL